MGQQQNFHGCKIVAFLLKLHDGPEKFVFDDE